MQIEVLNQQVVGDRLLCRAQFWLDGVDKTTEPPVLVEDFDLPLAQPYDKPIVDKYGRFQLTSGAWVMPRIEINDEWAPRPNDPADPYVTERVTPDPEARAVEQMLNYARWKVAT